VVCSKITNSSTDDEHLLTQLSDALNVYFNYTGSTSCVNWTTDSTDLGAEAWGVQYCTELFLPVCQRGGTYDFFEPKPINLTDFTLQCRRDYFVTPDFDKAQQLFGIGSKQVSSTSRIIFSNGARDPWSTGGILSLPTQRPFKQSPYFVVDYEKYPDLKGNMNVAANQIYLIHIPHACHHEDLRQSGSQDPPSLTGARLYELKLITSWIHEEYVMSNKFPDGWLVRFEQIMTL
jgi:lysosomal Pro-X carboxypeptidase